MPNTSAVRSLLTDVMGCDASLAVGDAVYVSASDTVAKADASAAGTADVLGFIVQKPTTTTCIVQVAGECTIFTSLTPDTVYYLSDTAGGIQSTPGTVSVRIGLALDATTIMLVPGGIGLGSSSPWIAGAGAGSAILATSVGSADGINAVSEGDNNVASGNRSHAEGTGTTASNASAHAEGSTTVASGDSSHAEGANTTASGFRSHAQGGGTLASSAYSHAEGLNTIASAESARAGGEFAVASLFCQSARAAYRFATAGDAQYSELPLMVATVGTTPAYLGIGGAGGINIDNNRTWSFLVTIIAQRKLSEAADCARFVRAGIYRNNSSVSAIVGAVQTIGTDIGSNAGAPPAGWGVSITAGDSPDRLLIEVTGASGANVNWVGKLELVEVGNP